MIIEVGTVAVIAMAVIMAKAVVVITVVVMAKGRVSVGLNWHFSCHLGPRRGDRS